MTTINGIAMTRCAHCGCQEILSQVASMFHRTYCQVFCKECGISTKTYLSLYKAIEAWNRRAEPEPCADLAASVAGFADEPDDAYCHETDYE